MPDIPAELKVACYTALPVVFVQARSIDVLKDVYELDLQRYVSWYCQWADHFFPQHLDNVLKFFNWMKLKVRFGVNAQITSDR